ncbi:restriction endonuclease [Bradyrhizobium sp. 143]|nr:restriction endonuclease [Bradyrhizobium sp. 143]MCK1725437.1 restriction endonuclease [Bradyrhizobium sp. 142]
MMGETYQGSLFSSDFLTDSITRLPDWAEISAAEISDLAKSLTDIFSKFPTRQTPNEAQTEDDLIWKVLKLLGWTAFLRQQNLAPKGREDVPDGILFKDDLAKGQANKTPEEWRRYEFGLAVVESKRWNRPLDRRSGTRGEETAPSTQMLRYLRRVEDLTTGKLRWGILTNGGRWRLYYQGARSVAEYFFEIDLAQVLGIEGHEGGLIALNKGEREHALRVFYLLFRQAAFTGTASDPRTFHQRAMDEGRFYEERVATNLSNVVFGEVFPKLVRAIAKAAPSAELQNVREAALILLYRLLFILYAEDRDLLPVRDPRYDDYGLRDKVRGNIGERKTKNDIFSDTAARYWGTIDDLCRAIDKGDSSIGLPPYNGGLFDRDRTPLLTEVRISDAVMADVIDALSFERTSEGRHYINYRDLSVQQLGSIYERLLEHEVVRDGEAIEIRPNIFARKGSGSYYTPDELVTLIIRETISPLITDRFEAFSTKVEEQAASDKPLNQRLGTLKRADPAEKLLDLKICDPAMGSGHFLVALVDYLADQVITAMAEAEAMVGWGHYVSPLTDRIETIRNTILGNAEDRGWTVDPEQLDDRHIIRRMILKRCIYGVDKNLMAVELAKVALWLHTFTVGAPLSFLDHHLRHGDSLFGLWVNGGFAKASIIESGKTKGAKSGNTLFLHEPMNRALRAASSMQIIEGLTDVEIAEAHRSADVFAEVQDMTAPLGALLSFLHSLDWLELNTRDNKLLLQAFLSGVFGDPVKIVLGKADPLQKHYGSERAQNDAKAFSSILAQSRALIAEEYFLHWQVAFPGVWSDWDKTILTGGFDAIIGNPPWDRIKLQEVEWFAARRREIALAQRAAERKKMVTKLEKAGDPLALDYSKASARAEAGIRMARTDGDYPLLSGGDVNIYSLFVERAMSLVKPEGIVGLLTPSGIASDKTAAPFFKGLSTSGKLKSLFDFENRRTRYDAKPFFPDVDSRFKFCATIASPSRTFAAARCAFFLQDICELEDPERCFPLAARDFARVNPNTGTAPIFKTRRDATLTTKVYDQLPVLVDRSTGGEVKAWPLRYSTMFHMTNDSSLFRTRFELEETEGAYPFIGNLYKGPSGEWLPLYEGKMAQAFDHRAANVVVNPNNQHRPAQPEAATLKQHSDPAWQPDPQFWVSASECPWNGNEGWVLGFKEITAATNERTFIAAIFPRVAFGNKLPLLLPEVPQSDRREYLLCANLNSTVFDFVTRQKVQGQTLNLFIVEQLPVVPFDHYAANRFGKKSAEEIVREAVLELTYTANDMTPFALDLGHVDSMGKVKPPFKWDEVRRMQLRAKLDAIYFLLYGITERDDVRYIYSTFPIVERQETATHGRYLSRDLCLAWLSALSAGDPDATIIL